MNLELHLLHRRGTILILSVECKVRFPVSRLVVSLTKPQTLLPYMITIELLLEAMGRRLRRMLMTVS